MITNAEYALRRQTLMQQMLPNSVAIIFAAPEILRNGDSHYPYRQNSDFYYLTGFKEPNAVAILAPNRKEGSFILFTQPRDPEREIWDGNRLGPEGAKQHLGAEEAYTINELSNILPSLLAPYKTIYGSFSHISTLDPRLSTALNHIREKSRGIMPNHLIEVGTLLHEMRLIKSTTEISLMRTAAQISAKAHLRAMQMCQPGLKEYQVEAAMRHTLLDAGCHHLAYNSIVATGKNACTLHYVDNAAELKSGDLLLIDVGGEYQYYAADITRTFPVNGRFNTEQRAIYELVLTAQLAAIETVKPGNAWSAAQQVIVEIITKGLIELGILRGSVKENIESRNFQRFYMHNSGHWLGLDVHDCGAYKIDEQWRPLQAGMVLTVEPGIYIASGSKDVDPRWWNIGVRIEDDVLVTDAGNEVLSMGCPKTIAEIEAVMASK